MSRLFHAVSLIFASVALAQPAIAEERREALSTFKDCDVCPEVVVIPAGNFMMGSPEDEPQRGDREGPQHEVIIMKPFAIGKFEVTFNEWDACVTAGGCNGYEPGDRGWGRGLRPVILISWDHAKAYVSWLSDRTGHRYRLLSEAEWEYAARAGTTTPFSTGHRITTDQANFNGNYTYNGSNKGVYRQQSTPVGSFPANAFGLHDVHGNVYEYVEDCWHERYEGGPVDGSPWISSDCGRRVQRGGSWKARPPFIRSAIRIWIVANYWRDTFGFRVVRDLDS